MDIFELLNNHRQILTDYYNSINDLGLFDIDTVLSAEELREIRLVFGITDEDVIESFNSLKNKKEFKNYIKKKYYKQDSRTPDITSVIYYNKSILFSANKIIEVINNQKETERKNISKVIKILNRIETILRNSYDKIDINRLYSLVDDYYDSVSKIDSTKIVFIKEDKSVDLTLSEGVELGEIPSKEELINSISEKLSELNEEYEKELEIRRIEAIKKAALIKPHVVLEEKIIEEPPIRINNFDLIKDLFIKYENLFPNQIYNQTFEEFYSLDEIKDVLSHNHGSFDSEQFTACITSLFCYIHKDKNEERLSLYRSLFNELCKKYEINKRLDYIDELIRSIWNQFKIDDEDIQMDLVNVRGELRNLFESSVPYSIADQTLDGIKKKLHEIRLSITDSKNEYVELKSFVLFDYFTNEYGEQIPYVLVDLDDNHNRCLIDKSIDKSKILIDGYYDYNDLIDDFLTIGDARITQDALDGISKLIRPVYYSTGEFDQIKDKAENATGMIRIRPTLSSYVRFVDEKLKFEPSNHEKMMQIKELMESKFKNVYIDENKPFSLYINMLSSFKKKDSSIYKTAVNRHNITPFRDFIDSFNKKDKLSFEDLEMISDAIDMSLLVFKRLKQINENFEFQTIDSLKVSDTLK